MAASEPNVADLRPLQERRSDLVTLPLNEIQRIRDTLARLPERHTNNIIRQLHRQVMELHNGLQKQMGTAKEKQQK